MPETASVFVSSTWVDLQSERAAVEDAIHRLREAKFIGMEHFGSRAETANDASLEEVDRSNVYVGIFGHRYGSGITEAEYRRARERGLPCFIYLAEGVKRTEDPQLAPLVEDLRANHITKEFTNPDNLAALVTADLHRWLFEDFLGSRLNAAVEGAYSRSEAKALLEEIQDLDELDPELRAKLGEAGILVTGDVHIGNRYFSVVSTRTFIVGFALVVALGASIATGYWYVTRPDPPRVLTGDFNIAIADFGEVGTDGRVAASKRGTEISTQLYSSIKAESGLSDVFSSIDIERNNVGLIKDEEQAEERARQMNADLVIWGKVAGDQVFPELLVLFEGTQGAAQSFTLREMQGNYAASLTLEPGLDNLDARTGAILRFIEGLVALQANDFWGAAAAFERAAAISDTGLSIEAGATGSEVYYIWAAEAARRLDPPDLDRAERAVSTALLRNPTYGRAFIVEGNVLLGRAGEIDNNESPEVRHEFIDRAILAYKSATDPANAVAGRHVDLRGFLGMGNATFVAAQDAGNDRDLMSNAISYYDRAISGAKGKTAAWDITWAGYFGKGSVYCRVGEQAKAREQFELAVAASKDFDARDTAAAEEAARATCDADDRPEPPVAVPGNGFKPTTTPTDSAATETPAPDPKQVGQTPSPTPTAIHLNADPYPPITPTQPPTIVFATPTRLPTDTPTPTPVVFAVTFTPTPTSTPTVLTVTPTPTATPIVFAVTPSPGPLKPGDPASFTVAGFPPFDGNYSFASRYENGKPVYRSGDYYLFFYTTVGFTASGGVWVLQYEPPSATWLAQAYGDGEWPDTATGWPVGVVITRP
jgi:tetratricopeptide (TPR) repeat protein